MINFPDMAQKFQMALKAMQMYTAAHPRSQEALEGLASALGDWLVEKPELQIGASAGKMFLDGTPVEGATVHLTAFYRQLQERQIAGFVIRRGVSPEELKGMLELLILKPARLEELGGPSAVLAGKGLRHITLSQTQYREVREGEGGDSDHAGPGEGSGPGAGRSDPAGSAAGGGSGTGTMSGLGSASGAPEPLAIDIAEALDRWNQGLAALTEGAAQGEPGAVPSADLGGLGEVARAAGWGAGFPTASQMESLRQAFHGLGGGAGFSLLKGFGSLPVDPPGLAMGFQALAPELVARSTADLLDLGQPWPQLQETLYGILAASPQKQAMLSALEHMLQGRGLGSGELGDLLRRLEWDHQSMEEKLRRSTEPGRFWDLSLDQRLAFMRELLRQGRAEPFLRLLDMILETLTHEDPRPREGAARTLAGVTHWMGVPEFPLEAEGPILDGLKAHFGWEPMAPVHRATEEAMETLFLFLVQRGEVAQMLDHLQSLKGLLAFLDGVTEWRLQAMERLERRLAAPDGVATAVEALHQASPDDLLQVYLPYFELLGENAARELVRLLGEEPDRRRRGRLLEIIRGLGPMALSALLESLQSPTWYLVRNTLNLLADVGDAGMLEAVAQCLSHEDIRVQRAAVRALWKLGGPACASHLLNLFPHTDAETQVEILFGLAAVQAGMAVYVLSDFLKSPQANPRVRLKAIETLGQIGNPAAIPALAELVRRRGRIFSTAEPTEVRAAAARALVAIGSPQAVETLRRLVEEEGRGRDRDILQQILASQRVNP